MQFFVLKSGGSSPMKFDEVKELIAIFEKSDMGEMEIKLDGDSVHLGRNASFSVSNSEKETTKTVIAGSNNDSVTTIENNSAAFEDTTQDKAFEENLKSDVEDDAKTVTAPIVGTYYQSQAPDKPPFVKVGDTIAKGDVVCIIEAMKFMNEVVSEVRRFFMAMDIKEIMSIIPHRQPFLLIDRVEEIVEGESVTAIKNVTYNEPFFAGHFPNEPVMPGVLIVEAMAQAGAVAILSMDEFKGKTAYFGGINKAKFKKKVVPGDTLRLEVKIEKLKKNAGIGQGTAYVGDKVAAQAELVFMIG